MGLTATLRSSTTYTNGNSPSSKYLRWAMDAQRKLFKFDTDHPQYQYVASSFIMLTRTTLLLTLLLTTRCYSQHLSFGQLFEIAKLTYVQRGIVVKNNDFIFDKTYQAGTAQCQSYSRLQADKYSDEFREVISFCESGSLTYGTYSPDHATDLKFQLLRKYGFEDKGSFVSAEKRLKNLYQQGKRKIETVNIKDSERNDFWIFQIYDDPTIVVAESKSLPPTQVPTKQPEASTRGAEVENQTEAQFNKGKYHALIIGINDYDDRRIEDLRQPISDANKLIQVLSTYYTFDKKNITLLKNPSRKEIIRTLDLLAQKLQLDDNLLIFFAGHGKMDESNGQGYWLPADAESQYSDGWLSNSSIKDNIKKFKCRHVLVLSDACFSGGLLTSTRAVETPSRSILWYYNYPSRKAITSTANTAVPDQSVFITYLLKRLTDNPKDYLSAAELYVSMREAVVNNSSTNQLPLYGVIREANDEGGDFIFVKKK
jgi:hypothetical protein